MILKTQPGETGQPLQAIAVGHPPKASTTPTEEADQLVTRLRYELAGQICIKLAKWAEVARVQTEESNGTVMHGPLAVSKSDLLNRLIYGNEAGPSMTPCPVHQGRWSGCHAGWPGSTWVGIDPETNKKGEWPMEVNERLQEWWDAGCRCATHRGSTCTTGWNPDAACGCLPDGS